MFMFTPFTSEILDTREEVIFQLHSIFGRLAARLELLERDVYAISKSGLVFQVWRFVGG